MNRLASRDFGAYAAAIRQRECSGDYSQVNRYGYTGAYQFGKPALIDAGFLDKKGQWTPYAVSLGVDSWQAFKNNPEAQDTAFQNFTKKNWSYLKDYKSYVGQTIGGIPVTVSGMLAGAHLVGAGAVREFLRSGGTKIPRDGNGVPVTEYMKKFGGYDFPVNGSRGSPGSPSGDRIPAVR